MSLTTDEQFLQACSTENIDPHDAEKRIRAGTLVFPRCSTSRHSSAFTPILIGSGTRAKVTALIGLGPRDTDRDAITQTMNVILAARPDAIMDLTTNPAGIALRHELKDIVNVPLAACLTYDLFTNPRKRLSRNEFLDRFENGLAGGLLDFVLIHIGMTPALADRMARSDRVMPTTSRGGGLIARYMRLNHCGNPLIEFLDGIIDVCRRTGVTLDLGDIFRPGCAHDAGDDLKWAEIQLQAELRKELLRGGVQVLCETGGHMPLHRIPELIPAYKAALGGAPLWLAGPMVIDNAVTLDDTVNTLGILTAGQHGGDMFDSITHNEHYAMPTAADTATALRVARVAITALEVARGNDSETARQHRMSVARRANAWTVQADEALYPDLANQVFIQHGLKEGAPCTICGQFCPHVITPKKAPINTEIADAREH
ncbi:phosphomethylpyrimidine synthase ThiC [Nocardia otitidiscaviarum]|nr:phosphomethylpyrimidine synthase ThiC [Nocardia otitidiscaviarum]MBF6136627.1 phosphomethylpyrimidine synthase ThiC [Nocardia otitidiscaviarum]